MIIPRVSSGHGFSRAERHATNGGHLLEVEFGVQVDKPRNWTLEVVGDNGQKLKDVEVAYPRLLVPLKERK